MAPTHTDTPVRPLDVTTTAWEQDAASRAVLDRPSPNGVADLLRFVPAGSRPVAWLHEHEGLVGWGEAARLDVSGPDRFARAAAWWREVTERAGVHDPLGYPGTGPVAFASMAFDSQPGRSVLVVPEVILGLRGGTAWVTRVTPAGATTTDKDPLAAAHGGTTRELEPPAGLRFGTGRCPEHRFRAAVAEAVRRMRTGELDKVVLARDLLATATNTIDQRFLLEGLARRYPSCWSFAVDGLVGATPELLLSRSGATVRSRVLAGTSWPRDGWDADDLAAELLASAKNRGEHAYAVDSLAETLRPFCSSLRVPSEPSVLRLRNVLHLASEVTGKLELDADGPAPLLRLAEAVHPTAAVGGTPTRDAVELINELEGIDRGRYAGPVGWIDGAGNEELCIALRCAEVSGRQARLFAGGGIVPDSDPDTEATEARAKFTPVLDALGGQA